MKKKGFRLTPGEFREKWAEALESGRFKQGRRFLTIITPDGEFDCCLGVACKVYMEHGGRLSVRDIRSALVHDPGEANVREYDDNGGVLPERVAFALGLAGIMAPLVERVGVAADLPQANDSGMSFKQIAKLIRSGKVALAEGVE